MTVTLLYSAGCPNWQTAEANVRAALEETRIDVDVRRQSVDTVEATERLQFVGSPTVLIDGGDPFAETHLATTPRAAPSPSRLQPHEPGLRSPDADRLSEQNTIRPQEEHVGHNIRP